MRIDPLALATAAEAAGMKVRDPSHEPPLLDDGARVWTMRATGGAYTVSPTWNWPDAVQWWEAVAWRAEDTLGNPLGEEIDPIDAICDAVDLQIATGAAA